MGRTSDGEVSGWHAEQHCGVHPVAVTSWLCCAADAGVCLHDRPTAAASSWDCRRCGRHSQPSRASLRPPLDCPSLFSARRHHRRHHCCCWTTAESRPTARRRRRRRETETRKETKTESASGGAAGTGSRARSAERGRERGQWRCQWKRPVEGDERRHRAAQCSFSAVLRARTGESRLSGARQCEESSRAGSGGCRLIAASLSQRNIVRVAVSGSRAAGATIYTVCRKRSTTHPREL